MINRQTLALVPHYIANLLLILVAVGVLRLTVGNLGILVELPVVIAVVLAYPTIVRWLGVAPAAWEE
ncbi:MAG: hypothetical protein ABEH64_01885 [Salinirussus sp.]